MPFEKSVSFLSSGRRARARVVPLTEDGLKVLFLGRDLAAMPCDTLGLISVKFPTCVRLGVPGAQSYLQNRDLPPTVSEGCTHHAWKGAFSTGGGLKSPLLGAERGQKRGRLAPPNPKLCAPPAGPCGSSAGLRRGWRTARGVENSRGDGRCFSELE